MGNEQTTPILLVLTAVAALSVAYPARANLITNPGFETGDFTGWTASQASVVGTSNGVSPHSGSFQATSSSGIISQTLATTAGQSYTVDFWAAAANVQGPPGSENGISVFLSGNTVFGHLFANGNTPYTEDTFTFTASGASTLLAFSIFGIGNFFLDDVSVNPVGVGVPDAGSTLSLLSLASLGLVALRRKLRC